MKRQILLKCNLYFVCTEKPKDLEISLLKRHLEDEVVLFLKKEKFEIDRFQFCQTIEDGLVVFPVSEKEAIISLK